MIELSGGVVRLFGPITRTATAFPLRCVPVPRKAAATFSPDRLEHFGLVGPFAGAGRFDDRDADVVERIESVWSVKMRTESGCTRA